MGRSWSVAGMVVMREAEAQRAQEHSFISKRCLLESRQRCFVITACGFPTDLRRLAVHERVRRIRKKAFVIRCLFIFLADKKRGKMRSRNLNLSSWC